jgi:hypothetical protein
MYLEPRVTRVFVVGLLEASGVVWSATRSGLHTVAHVEGNDLVRPSSVSSLQDIVCYFGYVSDVADQIQNFPSYFANFHLDIFGISYIQEMTYRYLQDIACFLVKNVNLHSTREMLVRRPAT